MARQHMSIEEYEALRQLSACPRASLDQAMIENLLLKGLIKPSALGGYALKVEGRSALRGQPDDLSAAA